MHTAVPIFLKANQLAYYGHLSKIFFAYTYLMELLLFFGDSCDSESLEIIIGSTFTLFKGKEITT